MPAKHHLIFLLTMILAGFMMRSGQGGYGNLTSADFIGKVF
jgi:hypothetical protein